MKMVLPLLIVLKCFAFNANRVAGSSLCRTAHPKRPAVAPRWCLEGRRSLLSACTTGLKQRRGFRELLDKGWVCLLTAQTGLLACRMILQPPARIRSELPDRSLKK